jgi:poly(3-hydroxybutyrate) depolymerase
MNRTGRSTCLGVRRWRPLLLALALAPLAAGAVDALPALHADGARSSASGLSSGGFMAVQYGVAYSANVVGLGVVAGGPYNCAAVNPGGFTACMTGQPSAERSWASAQAFARLGQIDPLAGLARFRLYLFSGSRDSVVLPSVMAATRDFFRAAGVPSANLAYVDSLPAGHAFIAPGYGSTCGSSQPPFIDRCALPGGEPYDQPKAILQQIYGPLKPAATQLSGSVRPYAQREFAGGLTSLDDTGYVYVPADCMAGGCAVHIVFHGCLQGAEKVGSAVYAAAGFNRWADTNHLIVLYPQVASSLFFPVNPMGCWDWLGYTGPDYMTRGGAQMAAVKAMVDRLSSAK